MADAGTVKAMNLVTGPAMVTVQHRGIGDGGAG
jgi:hypothetical protein